MEFVNEFGQRYNATRKAGYICMFTGNHDTSPRLAHNRTFRDLSLAYAFLFTMPGVPKIYYGDEIGMVGVRGLPSKEGSYWRTEARTPMQWSHAQNAGFSTAAPEQLYLPVAPDLESRTVEDQEKDPGSLLNTVRELAQMRLAHPALCNRSDYQVVYARPGRYPFAYLRQGGGETILVVINPADRAVEVDVPADAVPAGLAVKQTLWGEENGLARSGDGWKISLPGVSAGIYLLG